MLSHEYVIKRAYQNETEKEYSRAPNARKGKSGHIFRVFHVKRASCEADLSEKCMNQAVVSKSSRIMRSGIRVLCAQVCELQTVLDN